MKAFTSPEDAINATNIQCQAAWSAYAAAHKIEEEVDHAAYGIAKMVFTAGFMSGAAYVSGYFAERVKESQNAQETKKEVKGS